MSSRKIVKVGSRKSKLALIQTHTVIDKLKVIYPDYKFEIVTMTTIGDRILDSALSKIGEKSLFTKELEEALMNGEVDFLVHSLKDMPTVLPDRCVVGCVVERDDPFDAVVMHPKNKDKTLETLPSGSVIGTSSLRRIAQIKRKFPHFIIKDIRGNLNTRFRKLDEDNVYDAIILAVAGLERMEWHDRISQKLSANGSMYAVSQGAVAIECREDDQEILSLLSVIHHKETAIRCTAERAYLRRLEGGCTVPVSTYTELLENKLYISGGVYSVDGTEVVEDEAVCELPAKTEVTDVNSTVFCSVFIKDPADRKDCFAAEKLGISLADSMLKLGAGEILAEAKRRAVEAIEEERSLKLAQKEKSAVTISA